MIFPTLHVRRSLAALVCFAASTACAQFSPYGSATINNATTAAQTLASGTGTITSTGSITVSSTSVSLTLSGSGTTLLNSGTIANTNAGASGNPRALLADGTNLQITNQASGVIQTAGNDAVRSSTSSTSIAFTNYGAITASNTTTANPQQAVDWNSITTGANSFSNYGTVTATGNDAIRPGVNGVVTNYLGGKLTAINNASGTSSDGIDAQSNTGVQVTNTGLIEGGRHGITGGNTVGTGAYTMSITNNLGATIQGDNGGGLNLDGINGNQVITVLNNGTITGNGSALVGANTSQDGDGVDVDGVVNLTNNGTIRSINAIVDTSEGVTVGGGTIINTGLIEGNIAAGNTSGAVGKGITVLGIDTTNPIAAMYANTTITNSGVIRGQTASGITVGASNSNVAITASGFTTTITNQTGGLIEGGGAVAAIQTGPDNDTINNAGTIRANGTGAAIDLGGGTNMLNITGGSAVIVGDVSGGMGSTGSAFSFNLGAGNRFSYAGAISNFATVAVQSGTVTLSGTSTYGGTTTVSGGKLVVANATGSATGTGSVAVQNGGALGGNGTIGGGLSLATGATLAPGAEAAPGTLTVGGSLSLSNNAILIFRLGTNAAGSDTINVGGTFTLTSGQARVDISDNGLVAGTRYTLVGYATSSGITAGGFVIGNAPAGFVGTFDVTGNTLGLTVSQVPEPSTWMTLAVALAVSAWVARTRLARR